MNSLAVFSFESQEIRFVDGKPVANDVAKVLGYTDPAKAISTKVKPKNKGLTEMVTPGGIQQVTVLEEAGVYQLIFSSKLPDAERFQEWVFEEVLPSIRKNGSYGSHRTIASPTSFDVVEYTTKRLANARLEPEVVELWALGMLAKVDIPNKEIYLDAQKMLASYTELPEQLVTVTELCKLLEDRGITIKPQALNKQLCEMGLQLLTRDSKGKIQYQLTEEGEGMGKLILNSTGSGKNVSQLKWYASKVVDAIAYACAAVK